MALPPEGDLLHGGGKSSRPVRFWNEGTRAETVRRDSGSLLYRVLPRLRGGFFSLEEGDAGEASGNQAPVGLSPGQFPGSHACLSFSLSRSGALNRRARWCSLTEAT